MWPLPTVVDRAARVFSRTLQKRNWSATTRHRQTETRRRASKQTRRAPAGRPLLWSVGHACWLTVPAGLTQRCCCCGCWGLQVCISIICAGRPLQFHSLRPFDREFHAHNARCPPLWAAVLFPSPFVCLLVSITKITRQNPVTGN